MRIRALDSIRGLLLLQMTLDHFGKPISTYLLQCFGFFTAAEGFFFLSGFVGMLAANSKSSKDPKQIWMRKRALRIWLYHATSLALVCILALCFLPRIQWFFKPFYNHTAEALPLTATLVHTPLYFDVLPLYVFLMLIGSFTFPFFVRAKNKRQVALLWIPSLAIWICAQLNLFEFVQSMFPKWVYHGDFNPFAWQFVYFSGAAVAAWWKRTTELERQRISKITPYLIILLIFCFLWSHQFIPFPQPSDWSIDKQFLGPIRYANFFAFTMLVAAIVRKWPSALDFKITNTIGKHSLDVYTAHLILLFLWFSLSKEIRYSEPWNIVAPIATCILLWVIAKLREKK